MSMDPKRWVNTLPHSSQEESKLNNDRWTNTIPKKSESVQIKKYSFTIILFIFGLVFVSVIKNQTRILQKEINSLLASINNIKFDLHQATLDHEFITSPENISKLANEHLESNLVFYKKSQILHLDDKEKKLTNINKEKFEEPSKEKDSIKIKISKKIKEKRNELKKLQEIYSEPEKLPKEVKMSVAKKIEKTKGDIKELYSNPGGIVVSKKVQNWAVVQVVKAFLGIPVIPGK